MIFTNDMWKEFCIKEHVHLYKMVAYRNKIALARASSHALPYFTEKYPHLKYGTCDKTFDDSHMQCKGKHHLFRIENLVSKFRVSIVWMQRGRCARTKEEDVYNEENVQEQMRKLYKNSSIQPVSWTENRLLQKD